MHILVTAILLLVVSLSWAGNPAEDILGTWQLVEVIVPTLADSNPRGIPAVKEHYTKEGRLYFIAPTATLNDKTQWVTYRIEGSTRTIQLSNGTQQYTASLAFNGADELIVTQRSGDSWRYRRMKSYNAPNQKIEPLSVERLKTKEAESPVAIDYDTADYSRLPLETRLVGVWEVIAHANVPRQEAPPYGFLNDIWVFDGSSVAAIVRTQSRTLSPKQSYSLSKGALAIAGDASPVAVAFDAWGHLVLNFNGRTMTLKLITRNVAGEIPVPPLKIALIRLAGESSESQ